MSLAATLAVMMLALPTLAVAHLEPSYWPDRARQLRQPAGRRQGAQGALVELGGARRAPGPCPSRRSPAPAARRLQGHQGRALARPPARIGARGPQEGLPPPSEPAEAQALQATGAAAARHQRRAGGAVRLPLGQAAVFDAKEQRPDPDHAGPLYRAASRKAENDPKCNPSLLQRDASGDLTPSYEYQVRCPNDQNLIHVQGRAVKGEPPVPPRSDRRGIPRQELGRCVGATCRSRAQGRSPRT